MAATAERLEPQQVVTPECAGLEWWVQQLAAQERLHLPDYRSTRRGVEIEVASFLTQHNIYNLPTVQDNFNVLFHAGWRRHPIYPDIFTPPGFFKDKKYYLVIHCQITGERLQFMHNTTYKARNSVTDEVLFVGENGRRYLLLRGGWVV
jgi:hypothetical protein